MYYTTQKISSRGGLIIYLNDKFDYEEKYKLDYFDKWEGQIIELKQGPNLMKPITIGNFYRLPRELIENYTEFTSEFSPILSKLDKSKKETVLTGDFNIDLLKLNDKAHINEYFDTLISNSFYTKITY